MSPKTLEIVHGFIVLAGVAAGSLLIGTAIDRVIVALERRRTAKILAQYQRASAEFPSTKQKK